MASRIANGYARGFEHDGDLEELSQMLSFTKQVSSSMHIAVQKMRQVYSWREIGDALGMSGENARQRWGADSEAALPWGPAIYALCERSTGQIRYIGKATAVRSRILQHRAKGNRSRSRALAEWMTEQEHQFTVRILEECLPGELDDREIFWIKKVAAEGGNLLNHQHVGPAPAGAKRGTRCNEVEMRWRSGRRVPPTLVRCTAGAEGHQGEHSNNGVDFGKQPAESAYSRYMAERGLIVTLDMKKEAAQRATSSSVTS